MKNKSVKLLVFLIVLAFGFLPFVLNAQSITWQRAYFDPPKNISRGMDVCEADGDNFYIAGSTAGNLPVYNLLYLIKINKYGDTIWTRKVNPIHNVNSIIAFAIAPSADGGCVITGDMNPAFTVKIDKNGNLIWYKTYGGEDVQCYDMIKTSDAGYIACGSIYRHDGYILKVDSLGNLIWQIDHLNMGVRNYNSVIEGIDGGYIIAGTYQVTGNSPSNALIVKIDNSGNIVWENTFQYNGFSSGLSSICKLNGKYYSSGANLQDSVFFTKIDINGDVLESFRFATDFGEGVPFLINYNNNRFVYTSLKLDSAYLRIIDTTGYVYREKTYTWTEWVIPEAMLKVKNGDLLLVGSVNNYPKGVYALRTDSMLNAIPPTGKYPVNTQNTSEFNIKQNYPNPFNGQTIIEFELPKKTEIKVKVYDLLGREIETIIFGIYDAGVYKIAYDAEKLSSGIYIYTIETENYTESKKLVLIK